MGSFVLSFARHLIGYLVLFPLIILATLIQALIVVPLTGDKKTIPHAIYRLIGFIFGLRFSLNEASAPLSSRPTMFIANHLSRADFVALTLFPDAAVMMNAAFFQLPVVGSLVRLFARSAGIVGTLQSQERKSQDLGQFAQAFEEGRSVFFFPEGIQTDGRRVLRYSKGAGDMFFDPAFIKEYPILETVVVQPVVLRVKSTNGENVINTPEKWDGYALAVERTNIFKGIFRSSLVRPIEIDVLVLPPMDPREFSGAADLFDTAQAQTAAIVAPEQTTLMTRADWRLRLDNKDFSL